MLWKLLQRGIAIFGSGLNFQLIFKIVNGLFSLCLQAAAEPWFSTYKLWKFHEIFKKDPNSTNPLLCLLLTINCLLHPVTIIFPIITTYNKCILYLSLPLWYLSLQQLTRAISHLHIFLNHSPLWYKKWRPLLPPLIICNWPHVQ